MAKSDMIVMDKFAYSAVSVDGSEPQDVAILTDGNDYLVFSIGEKTADSLRYLSEGRTSVASAFGKRILDLTSSKVSGVEFYGSMVYGNNPDEEYTVSSVSLGDNQISPSQAPAALDLTLPSELSNILVGPDTVVKKDGNREILSAFAEIEYNRFSQTRVSPAQDLHLNLSEFKTYYYKTFDFNRQGLQPMFCDGGYGQVDILNAFRMLEKIMLLVYENSSGDPFSIILGECALRSDIFRQRFRLDLGVQHPYEQLPDFNFMMNQALEKSGAEIVDVLFDLSGIDVSSSYLVLNNGSEHIIEAPVETACLFASFRDSISVRKPPVNSRTISLKSRNRYSYGDLVYL